MATKDAEWTDASAGAAANDEWQTVDAEVKIVIENIGDGWIGRFMGMDDPNNNGILQAHFTSVTYLNGGDLAPQAFTNASTDLRNKLKNVPVKAIVRAEWVSEMDTGHESGNKMRVFDVKWRH